MPIIEAKNKEDNYAYTKFRKKDKACPYNRIANHRWQCGRMWYADSLWSEDTIRGAKAAIQLFHQYFFTLPPDDDYIRWTLGKAMYMVDGTGMKQKQAMEENGFFSDIVSSSATCTIMCDSIKLDEHSRKFTYYGTQNIRRRTKSIRRTLITSGELENVPRTQNNPHGLLITHWKTLKNIDLEY